MTLVTAPAGTHVLADFHGLSQSLLCDAARLDNILRLAAVAAGARILSSHFHAFGEASGVTGVVLLAESHLSIHTWPESGFAALDIFMCGRADTSVAVDALVLALAPTTHHCTSVLRGAVAVRHVTYDPAIMQQGRDFV